MFQPERLAAAALLSLSTLCVALPAHAQEDEAEASPLAEKVNAALEAPFRTEAEKERDANRLPAETLAFMRMTPDMRVLELIPGRGWYTKILSQVLADEGELFVAVGTRYVAQNLESEPGLAGVKVVDVTGEFGRDGRRNDVDDLGMDVKDVDLALTFRNLHNFTEHGRKELNEATFAALKPGGYYGVVDHTRRHMQGDNDENWRRMDPVLMIKEIEAVGFEFVDFTDLHYRADDELRYEVGRKTVTGNTDRFTLLFRKPQ